MPDNIKKELDPPPAAKSLSNYFYEGPGYDYQGRSFDIYPDSLSVTVKSVTIHVIEDSANDNGYLTDKAKRTPGALRVKTVEEMVH